MKKGMFVALTIAAALSAVAQPASAQKILETHFQLQANPKTLKCLSVPGWPAPAAGVTVLRGKQNDTILLRVHHVKPNLAFDLFTVEHSPFLSNGAPDPAFGASFGMAWYQSDIQADSSGEAEVEIKTILFDQIFGFDADHALPPTNTFHIGFWFNDPKDAAACGGAVTPFNGEHHAGPLAMISRPNAASGIGPLCTDPTNGGKCNP